MGIHFYRMMLGGAMQTSNNPIPACGAFFSDLEDAERHVLINADETWVPEGWSNRIIWLEVFGPKKSSSSPETLRSRTVGYWTVNSAGYISDMVLSEDLGTE